MKYKLVTLSTLITDKWLG